MHLESEYTKYPRTPHLPWSPGNTVDDIQLDSVTHLEKLTDVIVTEKLDGENTTLYNDIMHARSVDSRQHKSRNWLKSLHASKMSDIPNGMRICGENMYARHSIYYDQLKTYFYVFAIFDGDICLSWDETVEWCELLGFEIVPVLYRGPWVEDRIRACWTGISRFGNEQEGYVVRNAFRFNQKDFRLNFAKYVRAGHVTSEEHWMDQPLVPNRLAFKPDRTQ
ncbi:MAG: RNA ligase family protein [Candidatus Zixiibacteriota bacterium]